MKQSTGEKRSPAWLRTTGWLCFILLALATLLILAHWLVMNSGHQAAKRIVSAQRKKPATRHSVVAASAPDQAATPRGISLGSLPYFGAVLMGDEASWQGFRKGLQGMDIRWRRKTHPEIVDGVRSFRAVLKNLGTEVPDTMTEAEAATEYLKMAGQFSGLVAQWREAISKGPLDRAADDESNPNIWRFSSLSNVITSHLQMMGEAHLLVGDPSAAWADWQTMKTSTERDSELFPTTSKYQSNLSLDSRLFWLARSGVESGAWTNDQLSELSTVVSRENALASTQRHVEREKESVTEYYTNFHEHEEGFAREFLKTPSPIDQMANQVKLKLITEQQIQDNLDVQLLKIDQRLGRFDPDTGYYVQPTEEELSKSGESKATLGVLGSFYFMISDLQNGDDDQWAARSVIREQAQYDQFRLAAALETYRRQTGSYPDQLDAVSGQFTEGAPRDIATGQPYFYQLSPDGGYKLWGTGIDGESEGGNEKTDVTWKHRAVKGK